MRKGLIYGILLAAVLLRPDNNVKLAKMKPVETVSIRVQEGMIIIETDTEDAGMGNTLEEALKDLEATTAGMIYLDTADYLLVEQEILGQVSSLGSVFKGKVRLCERRGDIDVKKAGEYLQEHNPKVKLKYWKKDVKLQVLETENGRMKLR